MKILREMWVRDEFENILLSVVAVILSICLVGLIFLATNQNALAKVHQTICTFSKVNKVSYIEDTFNLHSNYTAKASEKIRMIKIMR